FRMFASEIAERAQTFGRCGQKKCACQLFKDAALPCHHTFVGDILRSWGHVSRETFGLGVDREFWNSLEVDIEVVPEKSACRRIRTGFERLVEICRKQRQSRSHGAAVAFHPFDEALEIGQVAGEGISFGVQSVDGYEHPPRLAIEGGSLIPAGD